MDRPVLMDLMFYVLVAAAPILIFWAVSRLLPAAVTAVLELRVLERRRARRTPAGPPLEVVVANLRRLRREVRGPPPSTQVRTLALIAAYDATLLDVCRLLGVDAPLGPATGSDRAFARLLTEASIEDAGIALDPPRGDAAAA